VAHHKSAIKRIRTNEDRRLRNRQNRSQMRTVIKKWHDLVDEGKLDEARTALPALMSKMMKSASKGAINKHSAARRVSRFSLELNRAAKANG